jgi:hypothetical protein
MNRKDLKELIKPLVKECIEESIQETILTSGILSQVISEVIKGMSPMIVESESYSSKEAKTNNGSRYSDILERSEKQKLSETKKNLLDSIGKTSYSGVNVFEGIKETIPDERTTNSSSPMKGIAPHDPGVDITQLFDFNKAKILAQGKKRK